LPSQALTKADAAPESTGRKSSNLSRARQHGEPPLPTRERVGVRGSEQEGIPGRL
jgi:hypothetical protein